MIWKALAIAAIWLAPQVYPVMVALKGGSYEIGGKVLLVEIICQTIATIVVVVI